MNSSSFSIDVAKIADLAAYPLAPNSDIYLVIYGEAQPTSTKLEQRLFRYASVLQDNYFQLTFGGKLANHVIAAIKLFVNSPEKNSQEWGFVQQANELNIGRLTTLQQLNDHPEAVAKNQRQLELAIQRKLGEVAKLRLQQKIASNTKKTVR